ncbi:MAG TPA: SLC13 family permease [Acidobacteriota bacterium]|nr:SLC13 family permease [Acidobacteriota bacterium]
MTLEIGILFAILIAMAYLFFTEKLPVDLTAFIGLAILVLGGFLAPEEAYTGFASPAVITMLSIFFVSAAMLHTGVADMVGARVHQYIGSKEVPLIVAIMMVGGILSAFMNNIAACAVLLPAVASISKKAGVSPSRLFMPLSFGSILGGTTTLVGTPPNILAGELLRENGLEPFQLFDYTPLGVMLLVLGVVFMATIGRRLLPERDADASLGEKRDLSRVYDLEENLLSIRIPAGSDMDGVSLRESQLGRTLGGQVVGIVRQGKKKLAPRGETALRGGDVLMIKGRPSDVEELLRVQGVEIGSAKVATLASASEKVSGIWAKVAGQSPLVGKTIRETRFRRDYGAVVVALRRDEELIQDVIDVPFQPGDEIFALGTNEQLEQMALRPELEEARLGSEIFQELEGYLYLLRIPSGSELAGRSVASSRMGELVRLTVLGIVREDETLLPVEPDEVIQADDELIVTGQPDLIQNLLGLGSVELRRDVTESGIESGEVGIEEATVAPRSSSAGKSLRELNFRDRFGLQVLAVWREGRAIHEGLADLPLRFGDALLLQGPWSKIRLFGADPDWVVLAPSAQEPRRTNKAIFTVLALLVMIAFVVTGFQPIYVAAFVAAIICVLSGAITMQEAYRAVEWRAIFLVAAILPVGIAMERTGAAELLSDSVTELAGPYGAYAVMAGLFTLSSALSQCLDGAPAVVLLTPVVLQAAEELGLSPYPLMMGVSLAASAAFMTPFSHKANLLVMGAGGYRVMDYFRVGTVLTIVLLILLVVLVPVFFPLH